MNWSHDMPFDQRKICRSRERGQVGERSPAILCRQSQFALYLSKISIDSQMILQRRGCFNSSQSPWRPDQSLHGFIIRSSCSSVILLCSIHEGGLSLLCEALFREIVRLPHRLLDSEDFNVRSGWPRLTDGCVLADDCRPATSRPIAIIAAAAKTEAEWTARLTGL